MPVIVTSSTNHAPAAPVESRGQAIARVVAERERAASTSNAPPATESVAPSTQNVTPEADPKHQVEIERRERALDAAKREVEDLRRELQAARVDRESLKDWKKALELGGHKVEDVVQAWLGDEKPGSSPASAPPAASSPDAELIKRLERLERKEQDELRGRARLERRQSIAALMPADSDEFEALRTLGDPALDTFMSRLEEHERGRPAGIGPAEIAQLLREFEGNTRKNLESEFGRLAKSKWAKQIMRKLLDSSDESAPGPESQAPRDSHPGPESTGQRSDPDHDGSRRYQPVGSIREQMIARARAKIVAQMR